MRQTNDIFFMKYSTSFILTFHIDVSVGRGVINKMRNVQIKAFNKLFYKAIIKSMKIFFYVSNFQVFRRSKL